MVTSVRMMRDGRAPTGLRRAPAATDDPPQPARSRLWGLRWWLGGGAVLLVCLALVVSALRPDSEPAPTAAEVNDMVDAKIGQAVTDLQAQPPASVAVYDTIRPPLVV